MNFNKIIIGSSDATVDALKKHILSLDLSLSYAQMMLNRVNGIYKDQCIDTYYVAQDNREMFSRLWNGWGKHKNAVGNFGNFLTLEKARGIGLGRELLSMWNKDISEREDVPLALFCSAGSKELVSLYSKFGFRLAVRNTETGPLYKPLKNSPDSFFEFCEKYYTPTKKLFAKKATVEHRHEIDCLLKFALLDNGLSFGFDEVSSIEEILVFEKNIKANILFTEDNKVAGWQIILSDGTIKTQVFPTYEEIKIENAY